MHYKVWLLWLLLIPFQVSALTSKWPDTVNLKVSLGAQQIRIPRDADITLQSLHQFRARILYIDSQRMIVKYLPVRDSKNWLHHPDIEEYRDTSLGKHIFILPLKIIAYTAFWKTKREFWAEFPLGFFSYSTSILTLAAVFNGFPPLLTVLMAGSVGGFVWGLVMVKKETYVVTPGTFVRLKKKGKIT